MERIIELFFAALVGALSPILIARYSKSRREQSVDVASGALKLVDMTTEQLEKKLNLIDRLEKRIKELEKKEREQQEENEKLDAKRAERDERLEAFESLTAALKVQIEKDLKETEDLRSRVVEIEAKYNRMKRINEKLVKALKDANIPMPDLNGDMTDSIRGWKWEDKK